MDRDENVPDRADEVLNREMRQLMILAYLRRRLPRRPLATHIKEALYSSYPGMTEGAVHRRFSEDMDGLRRARLISYADLRSSRRVTLTVPQKDPRLYFTLAEHDALTAVREKLGWTSASSPFGSVRGTGKLERVVRVLRLIEEGNTEVGELARALNIRPRDIHRILDRLSRMDPEAEVLVDIAIERDSITNRAESADIPLGPVDRPRVGRGLDQVGLFAYSREEVDDRIALIDTALSDGTIGREAEDLQSAKTKLVAWAKRLEELQALS